MSLEKGGKAFNTGAEQVETAFAASHGRFGHGSLAAIVLATKQ